MTRLVYAAVNYILQMPEVTSLVGSDENGPWIFANHPEATIENTGQAMIVVTSDRSYRGRGLNHAQSTARYPLLIFDIWADPTRNADLSVLRKDADLKIEDIYLALDKHFHLADLGNPDGSSIMWGTAEEIANRTGVRISDSSRQTEPTYTPALNDEGALMGRVQYNVEI